MDSRKKQLLADFAMVMVTLIWGATFVSVKEATKYIEPYYFLTIRFGIATILMLLIANKRLLNITKASLYKGILIGIMLFAGYAFQTFGLQDTTASNAGFITGLSVVLVPFILTIYTKKLPGLIPTLGIFGATAGLGLLTINSQLALNYGDMLVLLCAFSYAFHILLIGKYSPDNDPFILATVQIATVSVISYIAALTKETAPTREVLLRAEVWEAIIITAVFATAMAFFIQTWMQRFTSPTHTAIIFTMEPVFAAVFAFLLGGETFTLRQGAGAVLILAAMLASELGAKAEVKEIVIEDIIVDNLKV